MLLPLAFCNFFMHRIIETAYKLTKTGHIQRVPTEVYMQDTVACQFACCGVQNTQIAQNTKNGACTFAIPTPACISECIDLIECEVIQNMIVTRTALEDIRAKDMHVYRRIQSAIDTANMPVVEDRNAKQIREYAVQAEQGIAYYTKVAEWYTQHTKEHMHKFVVLCTEEEKQKAKEHSMTVREYAASMLHTDIFAMPEIHIETDTPHTEYISRYEQKKKIADGTWCSVSYTQRRWERKDTM